MFTPQRILGQPDIATTRIYARMADRDVAVQHARDSPALDLLDGVAPET